MAKDTSVIPSGGFCYRVVRIAEDDVLGTDVSRLGKELREFRHHGDYKAVLCPYWQRTDYRTVRCTYLDVEVVDEDDPDARQRIVNHFGSAASLERIGRSWSLADELKICGVRDDEDADWEG